MQDMTFRLDKSEIEKIMGASSTDRVPTVALIYPEKEQQAFRLDGPYTLIGKDEAAVIRLREFMMPAFAAMLVKNETCYHVVSLSKKKPVLVRGKRVLDHQLADGDEFKVGKRVFRYQVC
jgi:hypothetical protein